MSSSDIGSEPAPDQRAGDVEQADKADGPASELEAETRVPKNDMPTALSEMYEGRWSPINVTWKPHTKNPMVSSQKPCVGMPPEARLRCLAG